MEWRDGMGGCDVVVEEGRTRARAMVRREHRGVRWVDGMGGGQVVLEVVRS